MSTNGDTIENGGVSGYPDSTLRKRMAEKYVRECTRRRECIDILYKYQTYTMPILQNYFSLLYLVDLCNWILFMPVVI